MEEAALLLADANLSNIIEERDSIVAKFLKNGSFSRFDQRQLKTIAERLRTTPSGRAALDRAFRKDLRRMIEKAKESANYFTTFSR